MVALCIFIWRAIGWSAPASGKWTEVDIYLPRIQYIWNVEVAVANATAEHEVFGGDSRVEQNAIGSPEFQVVHGWCQ